jgi:hypothetical protein
MLVEGVSEMLWDFGFRHHAELQTKWIEGVAGLGSIANLVGSPPKDNFPEQVEEFLSETNPQLLDAIRNAGPEEKEVLLKKLEGSMDEIRNLIDALKEV